MNKKQVAALLKVISKDTMRPALTNVVIDKWNDDVYMIATNAYCMALMKLDDEAEQFVGQVLRRTAIERWYKLAGSKDTLTAETLPELFNDDYSQNGSYSEYPAFPWAKVMPDAVRASTSVITFNGEYSKVLQELDGSDMLTYSLGNDIDAMIAETERGIYILMPIKNTL